MSSLASQETVQKGVLFSLLGDCFQKRCLSSPASQETVFKEVYVLPSLSGDYIQRRNQISIILLSAVVGILWETSFCTLSTATASLSYLISFSSICYCIFLSGTHPGGLRLSIKYWHSQNRYSSPQRHIFISETGKSF